MEERPPRFRFFSLTFLIGFGLGSFVGVGLAIAAFALTNEEKEPASQPQAVVEPTSLPPSLSPTLTPDKRPRTKSQLNVHLGPGQAFAIVGVLTRGQAVEVVGRDSQGTWLAIQFPPDSAGRGWVPADELEGLDNVTGLAVALPTPLPRSISTPRPSTGFNDFDFSGNDSLATATPDPFEPTVRRTVTPLVSDEPPDLVVNRVGLLDDGRVSVTIGNRGPGILTDQIVLVLVRDLTSRSEQLITTRSLGVGDTLTLVTQSFRVDREMDIQAIVDYTTSIRDANRSNNSLTVTLSPPPTPVPTTTP